ncbi:MhpC hydrolase or acyltransferase alpha beta hydrolase superfamily [Pyrenophora tritici-repentis]|uniref:Alpha/beta hydrolase n=2 Tax=Pyrenophora tritici-repentis TaxID=45151 RepID=A0A2W1DQQ4_9PLEO|nr:uncharacterized protein PTRG_00071 [Pyrenophora tritici-repentis Pt-1C-BFP]KAA8624640.1 Alpha/beta hydrolase [Pyrenophora tritici-repentis]EDU39509.1 conserved hypothetical protein [Pyrenophora tritici-repentis Pt-1C-BFP]KAF7453037.1 Alpha/beta hydrolase [Pyrenophora tritici-repentis]KAF7576084.1 MhpC, hydrolase or acyltransferase (alpha-beta hydrolase superfamily) [Pyrenophora tritici-repentis]KAG9377508.1 hypothetical protein A1F94_011911 [Pyrenophora tritici-repentis]
MSSLAWSGFKLAFGLVSLFGAWIMAVIKNGALWAKDTEEEKKELAAAQERFWSLDREPLPGFKHAFFGTSSGARLHYVVNAQEGAEAKNLVIFIHGFPDSYLIWRHLLQSTSFQDTTLVAIDLPGYGGSDSLPAYGPNEMLGALTELIIDVREKYLQEGKKAVIATHDWGAVIGARLASEAHVLADHWIITGGVIPSLQASNAKNRILLAKQMLRTWLRSPLNTRLLKNGLHALGPVAGQFRRSFYIFVFHLPWPLSNVFATFGNYWFLRVLHSYGKGSASKPKNFTALNPVEAAEAMAISTGPAMAQLNAPDNTKERYGESVKARVGDKGMSEKIRIYREDLFSAKWEKSLEVTVALYNISTSSAAARSSGTLSNTAPQGALKAPATLFMGQYEPAFDQRLSLDNARDYLVKGSQVVIVKGAGHWLQIEQVGRRALEKTIRWALRDGGGNEMIPFEAMSDVRVLETL